MAIESNEATFDSAGAVPSAVDRVARRGTLLGACVGAALVSQWLASRAAPTPVASDLATLLVGMAAIKGALVAVAAAAAWWRFGHPLRGGQRLGYVAGVATMIGATVLIAHLAFIAVAAVAFHAGGLLAMIVAWRDDGLSRAFRSRHVDVPSISPLAARRPVPLRTKAVVELATAPRGLPHLVG